MERSTGCEGRLGEWVDTDKGSDGIALTVPKSPERGNSLRDLVFQFHLKLFAESPELAACYLAGCEINYTFDGNKVTAETKNPVGFIRDEDGVIVEVMEYK